LYQFNDISAGSGSSAAALKLDKILFRPPPVQPTFGEKAAALDLVVDLGLEIGSRSWLRGLATCAALCIAAWSLAPSFGPVHGASPAPLGEAQHEEMRALSISPLAYGADTGRRMTATDAVEPLTDMPERPIVDLMVTIGQGDGFVRALERAGVGSAEAADVAGAVGTIVPVDTLRPGTAMELRLGRRSNPQTARPIEALNFRARFDLRLSVKRIDGKLTIAQTQLSVDSSPLRIQGLVGASLYRSARAAGAPPNAVEAFIRAIAGQMNIGEVAPDDRFDLILEQRRAETGESEFGPLLYAGLQRSGGRNLQLMQWPQNGSMQWFEASGVGKAQGLLQRPVGGAVTSSFGIRRHPILGYFRMHRGVDFHAAYGTPILAATDGRVAAAGWAGGYGQQVRLVHVGGLMTSYSHMSRIVAEPGALVRQGEVIGYVGSTGLSTGPHLHYALFRDGVPVDPASVQFVTRAQLSGPALAAFRERLSGLLSLPVGAVQASLGSAERRSR
jgi:murein DD-endopeptidase MepM/ murein hydrolase activator NlpD